jgi:hypothetical protein
VERRDFPGPGSDQAFKWMTLMATKLLNFGTQAIRALQRWENEGGAVERFRKPKRPRDSVVLARLGLRLIRHQNGQAAKR